jgi:hypothetical protein
VFLENLAEVDTKRKITMVPTFYKLTKVEA